MDKDTLKGKGKDAAGRIERQVGEWTDRKDLQSEGAARQAEGKVQKGIGKVKEMGRDLEDKIKQHEREREIRKKDRNAA